jgi:hypothetical protein
MVAMEFDFIVVDKAEEGVEWFQFFLGISSW